MRQLLYLLLLIPALLNAQQNIMISDVNQPNEPSIAINPNNTNQLIAATNTNNCHVSNDGGLTWTSNVTTSTYGVWGDSAIITDNLNNFYFFNLSKTAHCLSCFFGVFNPVKDPFVQVAPRLFVFWHTILSIQLPVVGLGYDK